MDNTTNTPTVTVMHAATLIATIGDLFREQAAELAAELLPEDGIPTSLDEKRAQAALLGELVKFFAMPGLARDNFQEDDINAFFSINAQTVEIS